MMDFALSDRAQRVLSRRPRNMKGQLMNKARIEALLAQRGCPTNHPIVPFQLRFGGYSYLASANANMHLGIGMDPDPYEKNGHWFCVFGEYETAPHHMLMDEMGHIYADDIPLAASIQVFIEDYAMDVFIGSRIPWWRSSGVYVLFSNTAC